MKNDIDIAYENGWRDGFEQALKDIRMLQTPYEIVQILENLKEGYLNQDDEDE